MTAPPTPTTGITSALPRPMPTKQNPWFLPGVCLLVSLITLWPFWKGLRWQRDHAFMLRDMLILPRPAPNSLALGVAELPPRAMPSDGMLAIVAVGMPATIGASIFVLSCSFFGCFFAGKLVQKCVNGRPAVQALAVLMTVWNPFVIERFLQGQWLVATAAMLLPAVAYHSLVQLTGPAMLSITLSAMSPTGAVLAFITAQTFARTLRDRIIYTAMSFIVASPWILVSLTSRVGFSASPESAALFAARAEPGVGTLGALLGLGGLWNAEAIPSSRTAVAAWVSVIFAAIIFFGFRELLRVYPLVALLTTSAILLPAFAATPLGVECMGWVLTHVPGAGIFRDTHKFVILALPGYILMAGVVAERFDPQRRVEQRARAAAGPNPVRQDIAVRAAVARYQESLRNPRSRWHGFQATVAACALGVLCIGTVPTFPLDMKPLDMRPMSTAWTPIINAVSATPDGQTLLLPPGNYRQRDGIPMIDPALKILPGTPLDPGALIVDGKVIDAHRPTVDTLSRVMRGENVLAERGIHWVLVDRDSVSPLMDMSLAQQVLDQQHFMINLDGYELYEVRGPVHKVSLKSGMPAFFGFVVYWTAILLSTMLALLTFGEMWSRNPGWWRRKPIDHNALASSNRGPKRPRITVYSPHLPPDHPRATSPSLMPLSMTMKMTMEERAEAMARMRERMADDILNGRSSGGFDPDAHLYTSRTSPRRPRRSTSYTQDSPDTPDTPDTQDTPNSPDATPDAGPTPAPPRGEDPPTQPPSTPS